MIINLKNLKSKTEGISRFDNKIYSSDIFKILYITIVVATILIILNKLIK
jgi:hypothetical protein